MYLIAICVVGLCVLIFGVIRIRRVRAKRELDEYSIEPEALYKLLEMNKDLPVFDVRLPLDLLAHSEIIPGAKRVPPKEVLDQMSAIPKERDSVVYCTCTSEKTSRMVLKKARKMNFQRIKFLRGGLAAWKAKGYPVEPYTTPFHLDTAT
jgi:rhodanese-related sulfurtransferase